MRRLLAWLAVALTVGVFGGAGQANAAAFIWIAAPNWSYAAAACATPGAAFYAWALFFGNPSAAYAYTACAGPFGASASFAIAANNVGGMGAAFAAGIADPYAGVGIDTSLTTGSISGESYSGDGTSGAATSDLSGTPSLSGTGADNSVVGADAGSGGNDELLAFQDASLAGDSESQLCSDVGAGPSCNGSTSGQTGDIADDTLSELESALGLTSSDLLGSENDPSDSSSFPFNGPASYGGNPSDVIFIGIGDAVPEPASILMLGQGLLGLGLLARRRRHRRS